MKIESHKITIRELTESYVDNQETGVNAYGGKLDVRPPFQREFVYLQISAFDGNAKRRQYEKQKGICPICGKHFEIEQMEADHIMPWSQGGHTMPDNCRMLCRECNHVRYFPSLVCLVFCSRDVYERVSLVCPVLGLSMSD